MSKAMIQVVAVEPIGFRTVTGLGRKATGRCEPVEVMFPIPPQELRDAALELQLLRQNRDLSIREAARLTGLTPGAISGLEWCRYTFASIADRDAYRAALAGEGVQPDE